MEHEIGSSQILHFKQNPQRIAREASIRAQMDALEMQRQHLQQQCDSLAKQQSSEHQSDEASSALSQAEVVALRESYASLDKLHARTKQVFRSKRESIVAR